LIVGVTYKRPDYDPIGIMKKGEIHDLRLHVERVETMYVYFIYGTVGEPEILRACKELFVDPITQDFSYTHEGDSLKLITEKNAWLVQVKSKTGVTDAVGESAMKAMALIGIHGVERVESAFSYIIKGKLTESELRTVCEKVLCNPLIHNYRYVRV